MAGKRLLDVTKLFTAGRSVAKQHVELRQKQWDVYSKTSSLAKAVKSQTDRVTVTAGAAFDLARRFSETGPSWQQHPSTGPGRYNAEDSGTQRDSVQTAANAARVEHDNAGNVQAHGVPELQPQDEPSPVQQRDDGTLSSLRKRELQRQSEGQIPATSASAQPQPEERIGQDTFNKRADTASPGMSSLPRAKIPKHAGGAQGEGQDITDGKINQDVYYTTSKLTDSTKEDLPEGVRLGSAYSTPRVSRMVGQGGPGTQSPYGGRQRLKPKPLPEMVAAEERRRLGQGQTPMVLTTRNSSEAEPVPQSDHNDMEKLAESIADDIETQETISPKALQQEKPVDTPYEMRESRIPSSRFGRLWQYGGLATGMAFGAVGESFRRFAGGSSEGSLMLSEGNMNRLVAKLSRMRGAALKLGQMMSFQGTFVSPAS